MASAYDPGSAYESPHGPGSAPPGRRTRRWWIAIPLVGCAGLIGCGGLFALLFVSIFRYGQSEVTPAVEAFLDQVEAEAYDRAFAEIGSDWRNETDMDEFRTLFTTVNATLGKRRSLSMTHVEVNANSQEGVTATAEYAAAYDVGSATIRASLKKYGDTWRVNGINFESERFKQ